MRKIMEKLKKGNKTKMFIKKTAICNSTRTIIVRS